MKSRRLPVVLCCFLLLVGCSVARGKIEGRFYRSDTGEPVSNATVALQDPTITDVNDPKRTVAETTTDAQGRYSFVDVKSGQYVLVASGGNVGDARCSLSPSMIEGSFFFTREGQVQFALISNRDDGSSVLMIFTTEIDVTAGDLAQVDIEFPCNK